MKIIFASALPVMPANGITLRLSGSIPALNTRCLPATRRRQVAIERLSLP